ncbi:MAG: ATP-binding protein [Acidimicrobiia bacterium]|jgi:signal transduction histidine kinase
MRRLSVRWRITLVAAGLFAIALGLASFVLVRTVRNNIVDGIRTSDQKQLAAVAKQFEDGVPGQVNLPQAPPRGYAVQEAVDAVGHRYYILPDGTVIPKTRETQAQVEYQQQLARQARDLQIRQSVETAQGQITLVSQRSLAEVDDTISSITDALLIGFPALVLLVGVLAWYMAGRALRPVEAIRAEAASITHTTIHRRVPVPATHDEISRLASTMNEMLDRLEDASTRQRRFVSDASHELRSPVASIRTQLEVALRRPGRDDWPVVAERVLAEDERLEQAVADLVELARLDEGIAYSDLAEVDLDEVVFEECSRERAIPVDTSGVSGGRVNGRRDALARAVRNLVDNACRHATARVSVTVQTRDDTVELVVTDDGPGIAPEDRTRVFERFTRLDEGRARDAGGMGLGLAVVKSIVERHGGSVAIDDADPHGARFVVRIPAA